MDYNKIFLLRAIELSRESYLRGGGPFGAVIVKGNTILSEGTNLVTPTNDPTAHAEIVAIRKACSNLSTYDLTGCQIFTSCEPCPMCLSAIWWARIGEIYYANTKDDASSIGFDDADIYKEICSSATTRKIPLTQALRYEAIKIFQEWTVFENKISY